jgi:hypothetical protein
MRAGPPERHRADEAQARMLEGGDNASPDDEQVGLGARQGRWVAGPRALELSARRGTPLTGPGRRRKWVWYDILMETPSRDQVLSADPRETVGDERDTPPTETENLT